MTDRVLLDEMYPPVIAEELRAENSCLATENIQDFAVLAGYTDHAGLLLVNGRG